MTIDIRARVRCEGGTYGESCDATGETWMTARVDDDGKIEDIDLDSAPEGWAYHRTPGGWSQGYRCPKHLPEPRK